MQRFELMTVLVLMLTVPHASAEVYKWVDADGKVHYGDRRSEAGVDAHELEIAPAPSTDAALHERSVRRRRLLQAFEAERAEREQAAAEEAEQERALAQKCARVARDLVGYERANVVYTRDESGARVYLNDEQREQASAAARAWFEKHCE